MKGTITRLIPNQGFGFVRGEDGQSRFFHVRQMERSRDFDTLREGQTLEFDTIEAQEGPRCVNIKIVPC